MTLQQLRCLRELVRNELGVSRTALAMHTTQPAISKMIRALEKELELELFVRRGNRLICLTDGGNEALALAQRVLSDTQAIAGIGRERRTDTTGTLRLATTHIHARYALLPVVQRFAKDFPNVNLVLSQGTPGEILQWVAAGTVDIGVSTLPPKVPKGVVTLEAYAIERCLVVPAGHELLGMGRLTIEHIAQYPLVTYDERFNSGWVVQREFQLRGLSPRVAVRAMDANVIKAYVAAGLGVAVLQKMAFEPSRDDDLRSIACDHIFPSSTAVISLRDGQFLRGYAKKFIETIAPRWTPDAMALAMRQHVVLDA